MYFPVVGAIFVRLPHLVLKSLPQFDETLRRPNTQRGGKFKSD